MQNIFVYGTLKRGHRRHGALREQTFLTTAHTDRSYALYSLGSYPGLVETDFDGGDRIAGEVYCVDRDCRRRLDEIEEVESGLYELRLVKLEDAINLQLVYAYFYLGAVVGCPRLENW